MTIPLIDLSVWRTGSRHQRNALARRVDHALQHAGFLMLDGHGVSTTLREDIRAAARAFFGQSAELKARYATSVGGRGWVGPGREVNGFYGEDVDAARPDLKESYTIGREFRTGDAAVDRAWFADNVWPAEVPELRALCERYAGAIREVYSETLRLLAAALALDEDWFVGQTLLSPHTFNINRYPPLTETGAPAPGQYRIAPHTDWGVLTILDRQVGYGGLEVQSVDGDWMTAPHVPGAFTVNIGDLMARWTGDRWQSTRHRVLPPPADDPGEELISLIMFLEADADAVIRSLPAPIGRVNHPDVTAGHYLDERAGAATVS
jgi:isopenicillin N synthase-like dioxygenase